MSKKYKTIYADPPWNETGGGAVYKRGADRHYELMKTKDIILLGAKLQEYIDDEGCHLYLWTTNTHLPDALQVMNQWGFEYKTMITWCKDRFGLGQYFRGQTEHCLFGVRGNVPYKVSEGKRQQGVTMFNAHRTEHSKKPEEMRAMIEKVSVGPRLELFARGGVRRLACVGQ